MNGATHRTIGILVYEGCDLLDVGGPYEALVTAADLRARAGLPVPLEWGAP
ncbi:MAG: hypothetical protein R6V28_07000 [Nitriliruptoraceae bacterium]